VTVRLLSLVLAAAVAAGLVVAAPAAGAQDARPVAVPAMPAPANAAVVEARLTGIADPAIRVAIAELVAEASRRGLPPEPLVTKALEGVEKGAPPSRIEGAVRAMALRLDAARTALAPHVSTAELLAGADALGAGVQKDVLEGLRRVAGGRSTAVALGVVAQLSARGVPSEQAGAAVASLVRRGAGHAQLLALQRAVQEDVSVGVSPSTALDLRTRALTSALPPNLPPQAATAEDAPAAPGLQSTPAPRSGTPNAPRRRPP
jgi:hypothetical protein